MVVPQLQALTDCALSCPSVLDRGRRQRPYDNSRVTSRQADLGRNSREPIVAAGQVVCVRESISGDRLFVSDDSFAGD
jgi:hypothetical protein